MSNSYKLVSVAENSKYLVELRDVDHDTQYVYITYKVNKIIIPLVTDTNNYTDISLNNYNQDILLLLNELGDLDYINLTETPLTTRIWSKAPVTYWGDKTTSIGV